ncbi:hypothetical protein [Paractinoplanes durhamensis]|uniref:Extracellular repeat, HAF family n=1 Tax=Paractinoplanes durhamensis TaxID=113563 RepID=A0ABQ3ZE76_9ACTN|nr:hypothetical protein [Actinoplanes durhamensis]GIE08135.1 hypothetical protein Adu01nite_94850 [Actinoplanes durhamensis]
MKVYAGWAAVGLTAALMITMPSVASAAADELPQSPMIVLGDLGGGRHSYAAAMNGQGDIVGRSRSKDSGAYVAVMWPHGMTTPVPLGLKGTPEQINDNAVVAGTVSGTTTVFLWQHGRAGYYPYRGGDDEIWTTGINNRGQVVGSTYNSATFSGRAFVLDRGRYTILPTPAGSRSTTVAINDRGQILGSVLDTSTGADRSVIWTPEGSPARPYYKRLDLGDLGGVNTYPCDINDRGQVIGQSEVSGFGTHHPFLWQNGEMTDLWGSYPAVDGAARAINDAGLVVGYAQVTLEGEVHAVMWQNGQMIDMNPAGYHTEAAVVNERGQVGGLAKLITPDQAGPRHPIRWSSGTTTLFSIADPLQDDGGVDIIGIDAAGHVVATLVSNDESIILRSAS